MYNYDQPILIDGKERCALVLYGSETGHAQDLAEELGRLCERLHFVTNVCALDDIDLRQLLNYHVVLVSISTTGQGQLPTNAQSFWKSLRSVRLPPACLRNLTFASFGIGDTSYPKFNFAHRKLYNRLVQLGAQIICNRGEGDEQHPEGVDGNFIPWCLQLRTCLLEQFPLPNSVEAIPETVKIKPKWLLDFAEQSRDLNSPPVHMYDGDVPSDVLVSISGSLVATVHSNERVTPTTHFQDTRHVILTVPGEYDYPPGAVLTIYPKNFPSDVSEILNLMSWTSIADKPLKFIRTRETSNKSGNYPVAPVDVSITTLRSLLSDHLDIMAIPRRSFFAHLLNYTTDEMHLDRLREFTSPELVDELYDYTTRPRRSILEVLGDLPAVKIPWQEVCSVIPMMRGRQFSIASGGRLKDSKNLWHPIPSVKSETRVDLLVAIVKYRTIMKRIRQGVATRYIATFQPGQKITVTLQNGGLGLRQDDMRKPVVMIGPGTGVAPMRALAYERLKWKSCSAPENEPTTMDILFYGCRNKDVDEYFKSEWEQLNISVKTAYSRDQREKVYVQDLVRKHASEVFSLLAERGGIVFICGSSGRMPQAVRQALIDVFVKEGSMTLVDAEEFLKRLEKEGRYLQETW